MLENIQHCFQENKVVYSQHAREEMLQEPFGRIFENEVYEAILKGKIIESYLADKPYPSCLIFGKTKKRRPIHIVCVYSKEEDFCIVITVYQPNQKVWINYRKRRKP